MHSEMKASNEYVDEDGMYMKIIGWQGNHKRPEYLVRYSRPEVRGRATHALIKKFFMPQSLVGAFELGEENDIANPCNQGGKKIKLKNINRVLDMAWCCGAEPDCTANCIEGKLSSFDYAWFGERRSFYDIFLLLEWKGEDGAIHETWEFGETLMNLMEPMHCMDLLYRWANRVDCRQRQILCKISPECIAEILGREGWQYL